MQQRSWVLPPSLKKLFRFAFALALAAGATLSHAQSTKSGPLLRYYEVEGRERAQLLASLNKLGPNGFHAHTQWMVRYQYLNASSPGRCVVTDVHTSVNGDILMPRWTNRQGASPELVARWQRYEAALRMHENGHFDNGVELAELLVRELKSVPPAATCPELDAAMKARFDQLLRRYQQKDRDYDQRTGHGRTQGASF